MYNTDSFRFSSISDETIHTKLDCKNTVADTLNAQLNINDYTSTIKNIDFIFMVEKEMAFIQNDKCVFHRKNPSVEIFVNLNYNTILNANSSEITKVIATTILASIETYLMKRSDFDGKRFYDDCKQVLIK